MKDQPADIDESALRRALTAWKIDAASLTYAPVGFGDHHWTAVDTGGRPWFVTVADLAYKPHCGTGTRAAYGGLRRAMDTAASLREDLGFVVAPERTPDGGTVLRLDERYAVSVFPFLDATSGEFGQVLDAEERGRVLDLLAELHRAAPPASVSVLAPELPSRAALEAALGELDRPWSGGPYAESARALVTEHAVGFRHRLAAFDREAAALRERDAPRVVTHGEPHPGNLLRLGTRPLLVDWDTAGLAVPERDLWHVARDADDLARYAAASGHVPDPAALTLYRLRWDLDDVSVYLNLFRAPHTRTADAEQSWEGLTGTLARLTGCTDDDAIA
ncbi:phosphotransferase [Streptomyces sp. NPDC058001]|uniref:phosphotransferase n=1 Tax=Streptomyces sp. NPDC058001 TaxID=3346300 RepID=UPI0036EEE009